MSPSDITPASGRWFATTHWSVVLGARGPETPQARAALETLCGTYWYPLYGYVRRLGHGPDDAKDLTQAFFERFLEKDFLGHVDRLKGKFRSFLLVAIKHFLSDERDRSRRQKRGGGCTILSLDALAAEERYRLEPADELNPEKIYERRWALTLLERVLTKLEAEFIAAGRGDRFAVMQEFLQGEKASYPDGAARLGMTEGALRLAVHRMRLHYGELFRDEIAQTVTEPGEVEEEINHLLTVLAG